MKLTVKTTPARMTDRQVASRGRAILSHFDNVSRSDPYGWDWPTMYVLYPELCDEWRTLKAEAKRRNFNPTR